MKNKIKVKSKESILDRTRKVLHTRSREDIRKKLRRLINKSDSSAPIKKSILKNANNISNTKTGGVKTKNYVSFITSTPTNEIKSNAPEKPQTPNSSPKTRSVNLRTKKKMLTKDKNNTLTTNSPRKKNISEKSKQISKTNTMKIVLPKKGKNSKRVSAATKKIAPVQYRKFVKKNVKPEQKTLPQIKLNVLPESNQINPHIEKGLVPVKHDVVVPSEGTCTLSYSDDSLSFDSNGLDSLTTSSEEISISDIDLDGYNTASDHTYEPPKNFPEDLVIAKGAAVTHDFQENSTIKFDSDVSSAQLIEMPESSTDQIENLIEDIESKSRQNSMNCDDSDIKNDDSSHINGNHKPNTNKFNRDDSNKVTYCLFQRSPPKMFPSIYRATSQTKESFIDLNLPELMETKSSENLPFNHIMTTNVNSTLLSQIIPADITIPPNTAANVPGSPAENGETTDSYESDVDIIMEQQKAQPKRACTEQDEPHSIFTNAINCTKVLVVIKSRLYLYGTVKLTLVAGSLEIFGYNPQIGETIEIYSPQGYSSLRIDIRNSPDQTNPGQSDVDLSSLDSNFSQPDLIKIIENYNPSSDAIVILERNDQKKNIKSLRKYMMDDMFPNMNCIESDRPFYSSEFILRCAITRNCDNTVFIDPRWNTIKLASNSRIMVIGGKGVGKSTLVRYLINRNISQYSKILLIDLDIGQPEVFIPQTVSATTITSPLLGPGYFLNKQPDKAYLVGNIDIILLPEQYIKCVKSLAEYCNTNAEYKDIPWIINTMGYNKGFGDELFGINCDLLNPTDVLQIESDREINNFDKFMNKETLSSIDWNITGDMYSPSLEVQPSHKLTLISSAVPLGKRDFMNSRDTRLAMIISRISEMLTTQGDWITDSKPVCASLSDLKFMNFNDSHLELDDLVKTLVGNLVYLCRLENDGPAECLGIGIVRGVSQISNLIYLLPATRLELLSRVNCLALCGIPLPSSIVLNQGPKIKGIVPYVYNTVDSPASMYVKQMCYRPPQFLTGKRRNLPE